MWLHIGVVNRICTHSVAPDHGMKAAVTFGSVNVGQGYLFAAVMTPVPLIDEAFTQFGVEPNPAVLIWLTAASNGLANGNTDGALG